MKIGIDIDDVVVEYMKSYLEFYNNKKGTNVVFEDIFSYSQAEVMEIPKGEARELIFEFGETKEFENLDFLPGAKESISSLETNNKIFFITSRPKTDEKKTFRFFEKNFPKNNFTIHFSGEKWGILKSKGEICLELGIKVMVEDNKDYALECAEKGIKTFLLDKPWNREYTKNENLIKVEDWGELIKLLEEEIYAN